ncbi:MAG: hypothetical protein U0X40_09670 [Ferruginibacter sp.]
MKTFKTFDMWISIVLIGVYGALTLFSSSQYLLAGYFVVGGWQVISMLVHEFGRWFTHSTGQRRVYHWIALASVITLPMGAYWVLLFTAPFMAVYYTWICYEELYVKMRRPLSYLK